MSDCLIKKSLSFSHSELMDEINAQKESLNWLPTYAHYGHNTIFATVTLSSGLIKKIEQSCGFNIFKGAIYIWDYGTKKDVPLHKEIPSETHNKTLSCVIPLVGRFVTTIWSDLNRTNRLEACEYGPGDIVILNNRKYHHEGHVLDETRLSLHMYSDFELYDESIHLDDLIRMHPIAD